MFTIESVEIDSSIPYIKFACDLEKCHGACCTLKGGKGAPVLDSEIQELENAYPFIQSMLPKKHRETIELYGLYEGEPGNYTTMCVGDRDCVFVYYEGSIAKCAFERAYLEGIIQWRKPLSCHLFPIRVDRGIVHYLRYARIAECDPALARGERDTLYLSTFLREPLVRLYGNKWYTSFEQFCTHCRISQLKGSSM